MKTLLIVFALLSLSPQVLLAANAATAVYIDRHGQIHGWGHGVGDHVRSRCWTGNGNGRCFTISIDDDGDVAYSSTTAIKRDDAVHTATFNQSIDSQGRSSIGVNTTQVPGADAEAGAEGRARAGSGVPVTHVKTTNQNPFVQRSAAPPVPPARHMAPTREGRKNYPVVDQTPRPFAPAGYFRY